MVLPCRPENQVDRCMRNLYIVVIICRGHDGFEQSESIEKVRNPAYVGSSPVLVFNDDDDDDDHDFTPAPTPARSSSPRSGS